MSLSMSTSEVKLYMFNTNNNNKKKKSLRKLNLRMSYSLNLKADAEYIVVQMTDLAYSFYQSSLPHYSHLNLFTVNIIFLSSYFLGRSLSFLFKKKKHCLKTRSKQFIFSS